MRLPSPFLSQDPPITVWWRNSLSDGSEGGLWQPAVQMATIHVQRTQFSLTPSGPGLTPTCANGPKFASFPCGEQPRLWADDTWHDVRQCTEHTHPWILVYCEPHHSNKLTEVINRFYHLILWNVNYWIKPDSLHEWALVTIDLFLITFGVICGWWNWMWTWNLRYSKICLRFLAPTLVSCQVGWSVSDSTLSVSLDGFRYNPRNMIGCFASSVFTMMKM